MASELLEKAKKNKADEFYTQMPDIEAEMQHYREHFRGKVIFCNCDDPFESNFFKYFAMNFNFLGLKKLVATCYSDSPVAWQQLALFDVKNVRLKNGDARLPYKIEISEVLDANGDGAVGLADVGVKGARERLRAALEAAGHARQISVEVGVVIDSPARRNAQAAAERQRAAEDIVHNDPYVQQLMRDFGAKIVPGSIKPA